MGSFCNGRRFQQNEHCIAAGAYRIRLDGKKWDPPSRKTHGVTDNAGSQIRAHTSVSRSHQQHFESGRAEAARSCNLRPKMLFISETNLFFIAAL